MASIYDFKPRFQALLRPAMRGFATAGISPNAVASLAVLGSLVAGFAVAFAGRRPVLLLLLPAWLVVRMALNAIDGMMARELDKATRLGDALNEVGDVVSDLGEHCDRMAPQGSGVNGAPGADSRNDPACMDRLFPTRMEFWRGTGTTWLVNCDKL